MSFSLAILTHTPITLTAANFRIVRRRVSLKGRRMHYLRYKEEARALVYERVSYYARVYGVTPKKIFIKNSKTCWGSCSKGGNLNFHYKIFLLPRHLADYIVAHEVCHLREFNHSSKFWALVAQEFSYPKKMRKTLHNVTVGKHEANQNLYIRQTRSVGGARARA